MCQKYISNIKRLINKEKMQPQKIKRTANKKRLLKIIASGDHDIDRVKRILYKIDPDNFLLESKSRMYNMRTLHLAYQLRKEGCRDISMKFYKGEVLKVLFSRIRDSEGCVTVPQAPKTVPADPVPGVGVFPSVIDHKGGGMR